MGILDGIALGGRLDEKGQWRKTALQLLEITDKMAAELSRTRSELDRVLLAQVIPQEKRRRGRPRTRANVVKPNANKKKPYQDIFLLLDNLKKESTAKTDKEVLASLVDAYLLEVTGVRHQWGSDEFKRELRRWQSALSTYRKKRKDETINADLVQSRELLRKLDAKSRASTGAPSIRKQRKSR